MKASPGSAACLALVPLLFGSAAAHAGAAPPDFAPAAMHLPSCCFAVSLASADLNGDGKPDLATGNMMSGDVSVLLSDGDGYAEPYALPLLGQPAGNIAIALGDLNADGKPDLVVTGYDASEIRVYLGDGAGSFGDPTTFTVGGGAQPTALALADVTGDGKLDLVVANGESATVAVLAGDGAGGFAAAVNSAAGSWASGIVVADFDADGHADVATANAGSKDASILFGDGSGQFAAPVNVPVGAESEPNALTVGDVDGDGKPDLIVANSATGGQEFPPPELAGTVALLINDGSGAFAPAQLLPAGPGEGRAHDVAFADITGDGKPDIVLARPNANAVSVLVGDGAGGFADAVNRRVAQGPYAMLVVDVTGDGAVDVLAANAVSPSISILPTDGAGGFGFPGANFDAGELPHAVVAGDLNHDGRADIVSANAMGDDVSVLLGDGSGGFAAAVHYATGVSPTGLALGDVDGDGHLDVVSANFGASSVSVLLGAGDGSFAAAVTVGVGGEWESPYAVAIGDLNGDGKPDLATANTNVSNESLSFLAGNGDGSFAAGVVLPPGAGGLRDPRGIAIGDATGDGKADIVSANSFSNDVSILAGDGAGSFADAVQVATDFGPVGVEARDVNGDGVVDLVSLNTAAQTISVLLGDGSGGYAAAVNYPIFPEVSLGDYMPWPWAMTLADVNGDGKPDVVTANTQNDTVSVLLNDGAGGYANYAWFGTGTLPGSVAVADFDGDGRPDVVSANRENKNVSVLFNRGEFSDTIFANGFEAVP